MKGPITISDVLCQLLLTVVVVLLSADKIIQMKEIFYSLGDFLSEMVLLDWLIYNRDRHGANVEVLVSGNGFRMAPLLVMVAP